MKRVMLSCAAVVAVAAGAAVGDTVEMVRVGEGLGRTLKLYGSQVGSSYTFLVGQLTHDFRNGTGEGAGLNGILPVFCTDLEQESSYNWETYEIVPLMAAPLPGPAMGPLKAQAIADIWYGAAGQQFTSNEYAAAVQMLIWDIVYDYNGSAASVDVNTGTVLFAAPADVVLVFDTLRGFIGTNTPIGNLRGLTHPDFQDQVIIVPAPAAGAMLAGGMLLAGARRRRR
ncbi:MAG: hypothetical protein KF745_12600 [Phycisphaeraceae bacterium]|nr:hypothetical protein [Phycisphaeraceae bacterium]